MKNWIKVSEIVLLDENGNNLAIPAREDSVHVMREKQDSEEDFIRKITKEIRRKYGQAVIIGSFAIGKDLLDQAPVEVLEDGDK